MKSKELIRWTRENRQNKGKGFFPRPKELQFCGLIEENQPKKEDRKPYRKNRNEYNKVCSYSFP